MFAQPVLILIQTLQPLSEDQRQVSINSLHQAPRGCSEKPLFNCKSLLSDPDLVWKTEEHLRSLTVPFHFVGGNLMSRQLQRVPNLLWSASSVAGHRYPMYCC